MDLHGYAVHISGLIGKALKLMHIMPTLGEHLVCWIPSRSRWQLVMIESQSKEIDGRSEKLVKAQKADRTAINEDTRGKVLSEEAHGEEL